ncbi:MAG: hypothetical protein K0U98_10725 [Deltaproteobacteria bacterium]|nr:hypothetical protein [Deltaproteobacteria bacterium]
MQFTSKLVCDGVTVAGQTKVSGMIPISSKKYSKIDHGTGGVTWEGEVSDDAPICDTVYAGGKLEFEWTKDGEPHPDYRKHEEVNDSNQDRERKFSRPEDDTITDWKQTVTTADGSSTVYTGNIRRSGNLHLGGARGDSLGDPWAFFPLAELFGRGYRIPDLAPTTGDSKLTIHTAVNLQVYLDHNPDGFHDGAWEIGQTLDDLGLVIAQGQIPGLEGIYWSLSEFIFDPLSPTGWVPSTGPAGWLDSVQFQANLGPIVVLAAHQQDDRSEVFSDGFESGDGTAWSVSIDGNKCSGDTCP